MSNILKKFFPKDEVYQKFSYKDQRKLLNLIVGNVLCTALFIITSIFMFVIKLPVTALLLFTTVVGPEGEHVWRWFPAPLTLS